MAGGSRSCRRPFPDRLCRGDAGEDRVRDPFAEKSVCGRRRVAGEDCPPGGDRAGAEALGDPVASTWPSLQLEPELVRQARQVFPEPSVPRGSVRPDAEVLMVALREVPAVTARDPVVEDCRIGPKPGPEGHVHLERERPAACRTAEAKLARGPAWFAVSRDDGIRSSDRRVVARRIPTQLLELLTGLVIAIVSWVAVLNDMMGVNGLVFFAALAVYVIVRQGLLRLRQETRAFSWRRSASARPANS